MGCFKANVQNGLELESDIDFSKYDVFFVGEFHGVYGVPEIKLALIKYLNKNLIRDVHVKRFPFVIIYKIESATVIILSVHHTHRNPKY